MQIQRLSTDPEILLLRDFISQGELRHLLGKAEGRFLESRTVCDKREGCISSYRTSSSASLSGDPILEGIAARAKRFASLPYAEDFQVVRYFASQEFKPHFDAFDLETDTGRSELLKFQGRQRDATFLIYLSGPDEGGATRFTELGLNVAPIPGAAVFWRNVLGDGSGRVDPRTRHAGMPVVSGVKYAANLWLRGQKVIGMLPGRTMQFGNRKVATLGKVSPLVSTLRIGEFRPSAEADAKKFGFKLDKGAYTGTRHTLAQMARMIREGSCSPAMKQFAEAVVRNAGYAPNVAITDLQAATVLLDYVRTNVRYRPDPDQVELVQSALITLCVPGASICIPVGDCDDMVVALGSLMGAYGLQVRVMKQTFDPSAEQEHVLILFKDASRGDGLASSATGDWLAADPTIDRPIGWRANALKEEIIDPADPEKSGTIQAEFVGVGATPTVATYSPAALAVLAYRNLWNGYVTETIADLNTAASAFQTLSKDQAWLAANPTFDAATLSTMATAYSNEATAFLNAWNQFAGSSPDFIGTQAGAILQTYRNIVKSVGSLWSDPNFASLGYVGTPPQAPSFEAQQTVNSQIRDSGADAGVLYTLFQAKTGELVESAKNALPSPEQVDRWAGVAELGLYTIIFGAGAYALSQVVELVKIGASFHPAASKAKGLVSR